MVVAGEEEQDRPVLVRAVRSDEWKLIRYHAGGSENTQLFHIRNDPWELHNLAGEARFAARLQEMNALLREMEIEPPDTLFGLYQGTPLTERRWDHGNVLPDRIAIYQEPIEDVSDTGDDVVTEIGETLIHEVGHYFGLSEDEIEEIEDRYWHDRSGGDDEEDGPEPDEGNGRMR